MDLSNTSIAAFVGLAVVAVLREYLVAFFRILFANLFRGGQYNIDGDLSTPDWCEMENSQAQWCMVKILEYHFFYRLVQVRDDEGGLHDIPIRTLDFIKASSRPLSPEQREAVRKAGNDWPPMQPMPLQVFHAEELISSGLSLDRLIEAVEKMTEAVATKTDVAEIIDTQRIIDELAEWREKRPVKIGRHQKILLGHEHRISELEMACGIKPPRMPAPAK